MNTNDNSMQVMTEWSQFSFLNSGFMVRGPDGGLTFPPRRSLGGDPVKKKKKGSVRPSPAFLLQVAAIRVLGNLVTLSPPFSLNLSLDPTQSSTLYLCLPRP
jgi:hypothetical protein